MNKIGVTVNGYGVIGKRIADAVALQDDMELVIIKINCYLEHVLPLISAETPS